MNLNQNLTVEDFTNNDGLYFLNCLPHQVRGVQGS